MELCEPLAEALSAASLNQLQKAVKVSYLAPATIPKKPPGIPITSLDFFLPSPHTSSQRILEPDDFAVMAMSFIIMRRCRGTTLMRFAPWITPADIKDVERIAELAVPAAFRILGVSGEDEPELSTLFADLLRYRALKTLIEKKPELYGQFVGPEDLDSPFKHRAREKMFLGIVRLRNDRVIAENAGRAVSTA